MTSSIQVSEEAGRIRISLPEVHSRIPLEMSERRFRLKAWSTGLVGALGACGCAWLAVRFAIKTARHWPFQIWVDWADLALAVVVLASMMALCVANVIVSASALRPRRVSLMIDRTRVWARVQGEWLVRWRTPLNRIRTVAIRRWTRKRSEASGQRRAIGMRVRTSRGAARRSLWACIPIRLHWKRPVKSRGN